MIELLDGEFARAGFDIEDVVIVASTRPPRITVVADGDDGLDLDAIAELSRVGLGTARRARRHRGAYVLEVTSPGVDRPLTDGEALPPDRGRKVEMTLSDGSTLTGRLGETRRRRVCAWWFAKVPEAHSRFARSRSTTVAKAVVQVEFSPPNQRELELAGQSGKEARA